MNASSNFEIITKILDAIKHKKKVIIHSPGVVGNIGGYPIYIDFSKVTDSGHVGFVEDYFSLDDMKAHNKKSIRLDGIEDINNAVKLTLENNLKVNVDFIFGLPGEEEEDINLTISMMRELSNNGARVHAHSFIPLPQTPFANAPVNKVKDLYKIEITKLISKGYAFGDWRKQEKLAIKISNYMKTMKLE